MRRITLAAVWLTSLLTLTGQAARVTCFGVLAGAFYLERLLGDSASASSLLRSASPWMLSFGRPLAYVTTMTLRGAAVAVCIALLLVARSVLRRRRQCSSSSEPSEAVLAMQRFVAAFERQARTDDERARRFAGQFEKSG